MQKQVIGALVGGLILFVWQFLSFGPGQFHKAENQYTPNQDKIIEFLSENLSEGGQYFLPTMAPGMTSEQQEAMMAEAMGKPWARISYHHAFEMNFGMNLFRGFVIDFLSILLLIWLFMKIPDLDMKTAVLGSLAVGAIGYMTIPYLDSVWYKSNTMGYIIDTIGQWGLVGGWLGWWLTRK